MCFCNIDPILILATAIFSKAVFRNRSRSLAIASRCSVRQLFIMSSPLEDVGSFVNKSRATPMISFGEYKCSPKIFEALVDKKLSPDRSQPPNSLRVALGKYN